MKHVFCTVWISFLIGTLSSCGPYESKTADLGQAAIEPVLTQRELSDDENSRRNSASAIAEADRALELERQREQARASEEEWARREEEWRQHQEEENAQFERNRREAEESHRLSSGRSSSRSRRGGTTGSRPVTSPALDECINQHNQQKRDLESYDYKAPQYIRAQLRVGGPNERVSCVKVRSYKRSNNPVYQQYLSQCTDRKASRKMLKTKKLEIAATEKRCYSIAASAGIPHTTVRSRLR